MDSNEERMMVNVPLGHPRSTDILRLFTEALHDKMLVSPEYQVIAVVMQADTITLKLNKNPDDELFANLERVTHRQHDATSHEFDPDCVCEKCAPVYGKAQRKIAKALFR